MTNGTTGKITPVYSDMLLNGSSDNRFLILPATVDKAIIITTKENKRLDEVIQELEQSGGVIKSITLNSETVEIGEEGNVDLGNLLTGESLKTINNESLIGDTNINLVNAIFGRYGTIGDKTGFFTPQDDTMTLNLVDNPSEYILYIDSYNNAIYRYTNNQYVLVMDCVTKEQNKGLSTNDYTNADKAAVDTISSKANSSEVYKKTETYNQSEVDAMVANAGKVKSVSVNGGTPSQPDAQTGNVNIQVQSVDLSGYDTSEEVTNKINSKLTSVTVNELSGERVSMAVGGHTLYIVAGERIEQTDSPTVTMTIQVDGTCLVTIANAQTATGAAISYKVDDGEWQTYSEPFSINSVGSHTVIAKALETEKLPSQEVTSSATVSKTAIPTITAGELDTTNHTRQVTASGNGTVTMYKDGIACSNPETIAQTDAAQSIVMTATAKENYKLISDTASLTVKLAALPSTKLRFNTNSSAVPHVYLYNPNKDGGAGIENFTAAADSPATTTFNGGTEYRWYVDLNDYSGIKSLRTHDGNAINQGIFVSTVNGSNTTVTEVTGVPAQITSIGARAFHNCKALRRIDASGMGGTVFGSYIQNNWTNNLKEVVIPDGLTSIGQAAFAECSGLSKFRPALSDFDGFELPNTVSSISNGAFTNCPFENIDISKISIDGITNDLFSGSKVRSVELPSSITVAVGNSSLYTKIVSGVHTLETVICNFKSLASSTTTPFGALTNLPLNFKITLKDTSGNITSRLSYYQGYFYDTENNLLNVSGPLMMRPLANTSYAMTGSTLFKSFILQARNLTGNLTIDCTGTGFYLLKNVRTSPTFQEAVETLTITPQEADAGLWICVVATNTGTAPAEAISTQNITINGGGIQRTITASYSLS